MEPVVLLSSPVPEPIAQRTRLAVGRARRDPCVHRLAVHFDSGVLLAPGWDAEHQGELPFGFHVDLHPSIPWVARVLAELDSLVPVQIDGRGALRIEVYPDGTFR